jgi:hypothetical protein
MLAEHSKMHENQPLAVHPATVAIATKLVLISIKVLISSLLLLIVQGKVKESPLSN